MPQPHATVAAASDHQRGPAKSPKDPGRNHSTCRMVISGSLFRHFIETTVRLYNCPLQNARTFYFYDFLGILQAIWLCYNIKPTPLQADQKPLSVDMEMQKSRNQLLLCADLSCSCTCTQICMQCTTFQESM